MKIRKLILTSAVIGLSVAMSFCPSLAAEKTAGIGMAAEQQSDGWVKAKLVTTYTLNPNLNPFDIDVDVEGGIVTLGGKVESSVEKDLAVEIAKGVNGVKEVRDNLVIEPEAGVPETNKTNFSQMVKDATISARVKTRLLWNRNTEGLNIDVGTQNGEVVLSGRTESAIKRDLAVQIAKNTSGVKKVVDKLQVTNKEEPGTGEKIKREFSDVWITGKVKAILSSSKEAEGVDINVSTQNKVVTLKGTVMDQKQRGKIVALVADVVGVMDVKSELTVE
jgi:osmotically-inducible protein OsmY